MGCLPSTSWCRISQPSTVFHIQPYLLVKTPCSFAEILNVFDFLSHGDPIVKPGFFQAMVIHDSDDLGLPHD